VLHGQPKVKAATRSLRILKLRSRSISHITTFMKTHGAIRMTPAQAAGVENSAWTVAELVERCGE
jgi:hypothetical protein